MLEVEGIDHILGSNASRGRNRMARAGAQAPAEESAMLRNHPGRPSLKHKEAGNLGGATVPTDHLNGELLSTSRHFVNGVRRRRLRRRAQSIKALTPSNGDDGRIREADYRRMQADVLVDPLR